MAEPVAEPAFQPLFNKKIEERLKATENVQKPKPRKVLAPSITPNKYTPPTPCPVNQPTKSQPAEPEMNNVAIDLNEHRSISTESKFQPASPPRSVSPPPEVRSPSPPPRVRSPSPPPHPRRESLMNARPDFNAIQDEDDKWLQKLREKAMIQPIIQSSPGKVKKGSGFRYDYKKGYDRYFSSSEEETESEEEDEDDDSVHPYPLPVPWKTAPRVQCA